MLYSPTCQHALRALIYLASEEGNGPILGRRIAEREDVPQQFLSKILHRLRVQGFVKSTKGPGGGYELARPSDRVRVVEVIEAIDGAWDMSKVCILGLDECSDDAACALHEPWKKSRDRFSATLANLKLRDLAQTLRRKRSRKK